MRMWMVDPSRMCMRHIAGEHGELHKHLRSFEKRHSISGRVKPGSVQIEPLEMKRRHDLLAKFLRNHSSPYEMPDLSYLPKEEREARVDVGLSERELAKRCVECRRLLKRNG